MKGKYLLGNPEEYQARIAGYSEFLDSFWTLCFLSFEMPIVVMVWAVCERTHTAARASLQFCSLSFLASPETSTRMHQPWQANVALRTFPFCISRATPRAPWTTPFLHVPSHCNLFALQHLRKKRICFKIVLIWLLWYDSSGVVLVAGPESLRYFFVSVGTLCKADLYRCGWAMVWFIINMILHALFLVRTDLHGFFFLFLPLPITLSLS
jgi:hypothetical protein